MQGATDSSSWLWRNKQGLIAETRAILRSLSVKKLARFRHEPLPEPHTDIRLLKLLPGTGDDVIKCQLQIVHDPFFNGISYHTLSYEWGGPGDMASILVNGKPMSIPQNLYRFLWEIRSQLHSSLPMTLWADAICIDQKNNIEKNAQVMRMYQIYDKADTCLIWLGESTMESAEAFKMLIDWGEGTPREFWYNPLGPEFMDKGNQPLLRQLSAEDTPKLWSAVEAIYSLSYWTRTWIVQEVLLANRVTMLHGAQHLPNYGLDILFFLQEAFYKTREALHKSSSDGWVKPPANLMKNNDLEYDWYRLQVCVDRFRPVYDETMAASSIVYGYGHNIALSGRSGERKGLSLPISMALYKSSICQDPRDKVYALLGLAVKQEQRDTQSCEIRHPRSSSFEQFEVDYNVPIMDLALYTFLFFKNQAIDSPIAIACVVADALNLEESKQMIMQPGIKWTTPFNPYAGLFADEKSATTEIGLEASFVGWVTDGENANPVRPREFLVRNKQYQRVNGRDVQIGHAVFHLCDSSLFIIYAINDGLLDFVATTLPSDNWERLTSTDIQQYATFQRPNRLSTSLMNASYLQANIPVQAAQIIHMASHKHVDLQIHKELQNRLHGAANQKIVAEFLARLGLKAVVRGRLCRTYEFAGSGYLEIEGPCEGNGRGPGLRYPSRDTDLWSVD